MATITSIASGKWFADEATVWDSGSHPVFGDVVIIEASHDVELDGDAQCGTSVYVSDSSPYHPSSNFSLHLKGKLTASRTVNSSLDVRGMIGAYVTDASWQSCLDFGTEASPIPAGITFTWHMNTASFTGRGYYFGVAFYGTAANKYPKVYLRSAQHRKRNTYLVQAYAAGVTEIEVEDATGWLVNDELVLAPQWTAVDAHPEANYDYDVVTVTSVTGNVIGITATTYAHGYDDANDVKAGAVSNKTSNVIVTGDGDDRIFPSIYLARCLIDFKDVEFKFMQNIYSLNTCCLRMVHAAYFAGQYCTLDSCSFGADSSNFNQSLYGMVYHYAPYQLNGQVATINDCFIHTKVKAGYTFVAAFRNYYGGRNTKLTDCNVYALTRYCDGAFTDYQQPTSYINCKAFNSNYTFQLHDNVATDTHDCWAVGSRDPINTYNGDSIHEDLHLRWVYRLGRTISGWRAKSIANRFDFDDAHIYNSDPKNYFYVSPDLPDGCEFYFADIQNDSNKQRWFYSYGQKWWDLVNIRNDLYSIAMMSTSDTYAVPHKKKFDAIANDALLVGLFVKNLTASYVGTLTMILSQGSTVITTETFDLTTLTTDKWSFLSISGEAVLSAPVDYIIEYRGSSGEINITDFQLPFSADQKTQAKAVWAELLVENNTEGTFGKVVGLIYKWVGWLRTLL